MKQLMLNQYPGTWMTALGLMIFMALFISFAIYVFFIERKSSLEYKQNIPFQVEESET